MGALLSPRLGTQSREAWEAHAPQGRREEIEGYLESFQKDGLLIPEDIKLREDPVKEEVAVALPLSPT